MEIVPKPVALTSEVLERFTLRIAEDEEPKYLEIGRGSAVATDEDIPFCFDDDGDKSIMGFSSASEVGVALRCNMVKAGSGHEG